jgi:hypothetical protein
MSSLEELIRCRDCTLRQELESGKNFGAKGESKDATRREPRAVCSNARARSTNDRTVCSASQKGAAPKFDGQRYKQGCPHRESPPRERLTPCCKAGTSRRSQQEDSGDVREHGPPESDQNSQRESRAALGSRRSLIRSAIFWRSSKATY